MKIIKVINDEEKKKITRAILEALPEWFGILEAREESDGENAIDMKKFEGNLEKISFVLWKKIRSLDFCI